MIAVGLGMVLGVAAAWAWAGEGGNAAPGPLANPGPTTRPTPAATTETTAGTASAEPTAGDIVARYLATRKMFARVAVQGTTVESYSDTKMSGQRWSRRTWRFLADGERFEMTEALWFLKSKDAHPTEHPEMTRTWLWDGNTWYFMFEGNPPELKNCHAYVCDDKSQATDYLNVGDMFAPMWGRLLGDNGPIEDIIKNALAVTLRPGLERIGRSECHVIDVKGPCGSHTIWFDPDHGYNIQRARYVKTGKDLWYGVTVDEKPQPRETNFHVGSDIPQPPAGGRVKCSFEYEVSEFIRAGDAWAPRVGEWKMDTLHQDGRLLSSRAKCERTEIIVNPDLAAMDRAFKPHIREGTQICRLEAPDVPMYWIDGKIMANVMIFEMPEKPTGAEPADKACTKPATRQAK
jgi:hypothetical protein